MGLRRPWYRPASECRVRDDFSTGIFTANDLASLHAAFVPHVADFVVEFAADWVDDLTIDATTKEITNGPDGFPDLQPDRDGFGNVMWYTAFDANPDTDDDGRGNADPEKPVTYAVPGDVAQFDGDADTATIPNPCVHVISDATTGPLGQFEPPTPSPTNNRVVFIFGHSGDDPDTAAFLTPPANDVVEGSGKYWPYLLRIRYRLMDGRGKYRSVDPVSGEPIVGRWFEQIIPVPRPTGTF